MDIYIISITDRHDNATLSVAWDIHDAVRVAVNALNDRRLFDSHCAGDVVLEKVESDLYTHRHYVDDETDVEIAISVHNIGPIPTYLMKKHGLRTADTSSSKRIQ